MEFIRAHLLVASPKLLDPNFCKSVVLLVQHNEEGAFGVVLNRPTDKTIKDIWDELSDTPCESDQPLHLGGPVPGPLMALHTHESLSDAEILPGVYFSVQKENLNEIVTQADGFFTLFVGHAGWGAGQLEAELMEGSWLTTPAKLEHVFQAEEHDWDKVLKAIGDSRLVTPLKVKHVPKDPTMN